MGNFMNSEIVGKPSDGPWAIVFERVDMLPRHPAQLYEAVSYISIFLFLTFLYRFKRENFKTGFLFGLFLVLIFTVRIAVEFVKVKQADYDTSFMMMSTGQALSIPFMIIGVGLMIWSFKK